MFNIKHTIQISSLLSFIIVICFVLTMTAFADDKKDYFIQHAQNKYFDTPVSARSLGMGGSDLPTMVNASSLFSNPAGLGWLVRPALSLNYAFDEISGEDFPQVYGIDEDLNIAFLQGACPIKGGEWGVFGGGFTMYNTDVSNRIDTETDGFSIHAAYGLQLNPEWSAGYSFAYFDDEEENDYTDYEMDDGFRNTAGIQFRPSEEWMIGLYGFYAFGDPESEIVLLGEQDGDRDSWGINIGAAWRAQEKTLIAVSFDYTDYELDSTIVNPALGVNEVVDEEGKSFGVSVGVEHSFLDCLDGRLGLSLPQ